MVLRRFEVVILSGRIIETNVANKHGVRFDALLRVRGPICARTASTATPACVARPVVRICCAHARRGRTRQSWSRPPPWCSWTFPRCGHSRPVAFSDAMGHHLRCRRHILVPLAHEGKRCCLAGKASTLIVLRVNAIVADCAVLYHPCSKYTR